MDIMKKTFGPIHALMLIILSILILAPRPLAGYLDLAQAEERSTGHLKSLDIAPYYASAAERIPWRPDLYEQAGFAYQNGGDNSTAEKFYRIANLHHALSSNGWMAWGSAVYAQGDVPGAVAIWEEALKQKDPDPFVHAYLADGYEKVKNYAGAMQEWKIFLPTSTDYPFGHYRLGLLLMATAPEEALPELMQAAQLDPDLEPTVQGLRTALNTAFLSDDKATHLLAAGRALGTLGEWNLAADAFHNAITTRTDYAEAWAWLGEAEQQLGQGGSHEIEQALTFNPESAMVQGLYGLYLQRQGKPDSALAAFHKAADLEPQDAGWQLALGSASEQTGDLITAYEYYLHAVELAPKDASTWRALATFSVNNNVDVNKTGLPAAQKLIELAPDDWKSYDLAGQAAFLLEDYIDAEIYLKKAVQMNPTQAAPALHLGLVYMQTGNRDKAFSYLALARTLDPDGPNGWQAGRLLEQYFP
jgi:tetratricopeptide (TPR) repeat protein